MPSFEGISWPSGTKFGHNKLGTLRHYMWKPGVSTWPGLESVLSRDRQTDRWKDRITIAKLCFLYKQSTHSVSVHNVFGFYEFTRLCSACSVCRHSHGHFKTSAWRAFHVFVSQIYFLYCPMVLFCLSVSVCFVATGFLVWIKIIITNETNLIHNFHPQGLRARKLHYYKRIQLTPSKVVEWSRG